MCQFLGFFLVLLRNSVMERRIFQAAHPQTVINCMTPRESTHFKYSFQSIIRSIKVIGIEISKIRKIITLNLGSLKHCSTNLYSQKQQKITASKNIMSDK